MLIEFMAGKVAAIEGSCYDATPFTYTEDDDPITFFGDCLRKRESVTRATNHDIRLNLSV